MADSRISNLIHKNNIRLFEEEASKDLIEQDSYSFKSKEKTSLSLENKKNNFQKDFHADIHLPHAVYGKYGIITDSEHIHDKLYEELTHFLGTKNPSSFKYIPYEFQSRNNHISNQQYSYSLNNVANITSIQKLLETNIQKRLKSEPFIKKDENMRNKEKKSIEKKDFFPLSVRNGNVFERRSWDVPTSQEYPLSADSDSLKANLDFDPSINSQNVEEKTYLFRNKGCFSSKYNPHLSYMNEISIQDNNSKSKILLNSRNIQEEKEFLVEENSRQNFCERKPKTEEIFFKPNMDFQTKEHQNQELRNWSTKNRTKIWNQPVYKKGLKSDLNETASFSQNYQNNWEQLEQQQQQPCSHQMDLSFISLPIKKHQKPNSNIKLLLNNYCINRNSFQEKATPTYRTPIIQDIGEGEMPTAHGDGLYKGEEDKPAVFSVDASGLKGDLFVQVDGPNSIAKCNIDPEANGTYTVTYVPVEVGLYDVEVKWNNKEIQGSPFHPKIVNARKVHIIGGWQHMMDSDDRVHLVVDEMKKIPFDISEAGPGKLTAQVMGPNNDWLPVHIDTSSDGKNTLCFTPKEEGNHYINVYWTEHSLVGAPFLGYAVTKPVNSGYDNSQVILSGRGLKEAVVREESEFHIDGSNAGPGKPEVSLMGVRSEIEVFTKPLGNGHYHCTYTPVVPGGYLLHITWNNRQLKGSPYKVSVVAAAQPQKVNVTGEGLEGGILGRELQVNIDTRKAGPGELTAHCMGPTRIAYCELMDNHDGIYKLTVRPQESGRHILQIKYGGENVLGSPYVLKIGAQPDASKVRVSGPGVEHGILATFKSHFLVETDGAGAGKLTVRIRGPKGAFQVHMSRESQRDRRIICHYDPFETGLYIIQVKWSEIDVPGSPFHVQIVDTHQEYEAISQEVLSLHNGYTSESLLHRPAFSPWKEDI